MKRYANVLGDAAHEIPRHRLEVRNGKWVTVSERGSVRTASGRYLFVVTHDGTHFVSKRFPAQVGRTVSHADLAAGRDVRYAGEIQFSGRSNRGTIRWWNNQSGHYLPDFESADQAGLPMELFRPIA